MNRATEPQRVQLHATFEALCLIESPTGRERTCANWVTSELASVGVDLEEDGAGPAAGSDSGNLYAWIPGRGPRSLMMCAHLDTVPLTAPVQPVLRDGGWQNANAGILGADNKAALAALIELARILQAAPEPPEVGLELIFTVCEETGLHGAGQFDVSALHSDFGYVFDHASPLGEIVIASPSQQQIVAQIRGRAAHAGISPEDGRSAIAVAARAIAVMALGRLDAETTANIGTISGGTAANVVPERCRLHGEVRGFDEGPLGEALTAIIDALQDAADDGECDLDLEIERIFSGYRLKPSEPAVQLASRALRTIGYEPTMIASGGGSDANAFRVAGFPVVNLANGTERPHEPGERVSAEALEGGLDLAITLMTLAAGAGEGTSAR